MIDKDNKFKLMFDDNVLSFIGGKLIDILLNSGILETAIITKDKTR
jgi:hypothetical protein